MFTVVYEFRVNPGLEEVFHLHWRDVTRLIQEERKSLGSRLHRSKDGSFIAYAQWPSREMWSNPPVSSPALAKAVEQMNACLNHFEIKLELEVVDDLLTHNADSSYRKHNEASVGLRQLKPHGTHNTDESKSL